MRHTLVGYTGFVGQNLAQQLPFDGLYNSKNIEESFGADNGFVVYSGMPSEKFLANADPAADKARAEQALANIRQMRPEKLVLISTVDVYPNPVNVYENTPAGGENAHAYGQNRLLLEEWVREDFPSALIIRLPGLFGKGLRKNFIYDMFHLIPPMLTAEKYAELKEKEPLVGECYTQKDERFYKLNTLDDATRKALKAFYAGNDFNSLSFTDSRSVYQFYDLKNLWNDINRCLKAGLQLVNMGTEPIGAGALYHMLFGEEFENHLPKPPAHYDMRTHYGRELGGNDHYIADRAEVVAGIAKYAATLDNE